MTQQEETVSVAKSTIIFKTTDEWFKTLVSGVVETFFPDKELTFSIEIRKYRTDRQGWCYAWEKPSRIIIIHKHINDGLELANTIAHEIIHTFTEGREAIFGKKDAHGTAFRKEAAKIGLITMDQDTLAMREFIEKSVPVLEKSGYKATLCFPETVYFLTWGDYVYFVKDDNGKWIGYPYHGLNGIVNLEAVKEVCRRLEFLDKTVFKGVMSKNKFPCFCSYRMMATDFGSLVSMLRKLYLKKKSPQDKACLQVFNQLIKDKKIDSTEKPLEFYSVLKDEKRGSIPVSELVPANEIFMLSKSNEEFSFSVSSQNQTDVSTSQIRQISGLCRFLSECLFPSKRPVKPHVLIRVNQPKENVETYSAYLSKKMAELFGVDPSGIRESDYLPFLEGFGNLICENEKVKFQRVIYRRVSF